MTVSDEVQNVLHRAFVGAREAGHAILTPEHIALELILEQEASTYLERSGTDLVAVESRLREHLGKIESSPSAEFETVPTSTFQRIVENAFQRTQADRREYVMLRDLFLAIIDERKSIASSAILEATRDEEFFEELRTFRSELEGPDAV
jgi:ATP-dependent Clp protease ATP-binding subunit ClpA